MEIAVNSSGCQNGRDERWKNWFGRRWDERKVPGQSKWVAVRELGALALLTNRIEIGDSSILRIYVSSGYVHWLGATKSHESLCSDFAFVKIKIHLIVTWTSAISYIKLQRRPNIAWSVIIRKAPKDVIIVPHPHVQHQPQSSRSLQSLQPTSSS